MTLSQKPCPYKKEQLSQLLFRIFTVYLFFPDPEQQEHVSEPPNRSWKYPWPAQYGQWFAVVLFLKTVIRNTSSVVFNILIISNISRIANRRKQKRTFVNGYKRLFLHYSLLFFIILSFSKLSVN